MVAGVKAAWFVTGYAEDDASCSWDVDMTIKAVSDS